MNLIFRMLYVLIASLFKPRLYFSQADIENRYVSHTNSNNKRARSKRPKNSLTLRVLPNNIDINLHMNNGRYLTICDLTRVDLFIRTGLVKAMRRNNWMPVVAEHTMTYKKSLNVFQKYQVHMEVIDWDEKAFNMTHTFTVGDRIVATGTSRGVIVGPNGVVPPKQVIQEVSD